MLIFDGGLETLLLQSQYSLPGQASGDFGWVVPVPSLPELASMEPAHASQLFRELSRVSAPRTYRLRVWIPAAVALLAVVVILGLPIAALVSRTGSGRWSEKRRERLLRAWGTLAFAAFVYLACGATMFLFLQTSMGRGTSGVEVIRAEQVGIYDVQVIRSRQAADLIDWLNQHQFQFDEADTEVFEHYLQQGWYFVVARIDPTAAQQEDRAGRDGLVAPLILRFQAAAPVYPLALTATAGQGTRLLLYLLSEGRWEAGGRLDLVFAGPANLPFFQQATELGTTPERQLTDPAGFFSRADVDQAYLCRFSGGLSPAEMREDLVFTPADTNRPFREITILW
jgi:hypothetical protein